MNRVWIYSISRLTKTERKMLKQTNKQTSEHPPNKNNNNNNIIIITNQKLCKFPVLTGESSRANFLPAHDASKRRNAWNRLLLQGNLLQIQNKRNQSGSQEWTVSRSQLKPRKARVTPLRKTQDQSIDRSISNKKGGTRPSLSLPAKNDCSTHLRRLCECNNKGTNIHDRNFIYNILGE